jgi:hypothetical protein
MAEPLKLRRFRMLVMGSQIPFRDGYDFTPDRARKWLQHSYTVTHAREPQLPTIVGECASLPDRGWEFFAGELSNSGVLDVRGNPEYLRFHQPTWYLEIETNDLVKRLKSYGAGAMTTFGKDDEPLADVWAVSLAIGAAELLAARLPWSEKLELRPVKPGADELAELLAIQ